MLFTLALAVLMGFASLTIDVGQLMHERQSHQNAADAAALAGARELPDTDAAIEVARDYAVRHGYDSSDIKSITVTTTNTAADTVTVRLESQFEWGLASALGMFDTTVGAHASATAWSPAAAANVTPWAVVESAIVDDGSPTVLKYDSNNPTTGNFGTLALDGTGSSTYETTIKFGSNASLCAQAQPGCSDPTATTAPGNLTGATRDGMEYLMDNTSTDCDDFDEVLHEGVDGRYSVWERCNPWSGATDSKRLVLVPVVPSLCNGSCDVTILYFAVFFLDTIDSCTGSNCEVTGSFVDVVVNPDAILGSFNSNNAITNVKLTA